jgi:hypothetical protein
VLETPDIILKYVVIEIAYGEASLRKRIVPLIVGIFVSAFLAFVFLHVTSHTFSYKKKEDICFSGHRAF